MSVLDRTRTDGLVILTLNRPEKHNALSAELVETLLDELERARTEPTDLMVLRGAGPSFSAGFDLSGLDRACDAELLHRFVRIEQLLAGIHHAPFATLALTHGRVFGAGADLMCACTHRVAANDTRFRLPGTAFGIVLGTGRLARLVGADEARAIQCGGLTVDAVHAHRRGMVTRISDPSEWDDVITDAHAVEAALAPRTRANLHSVLHTDHRDADLAALVRSAAEPGLVDRIRAYASARAPGVAVSGREF